MDSEARYLTNAEFARSGALCPPRTHRELPLHCRYHYRRRSRGGAPPPSARTRSPFERSDLRAHAIHPFATTARWPVLGFADALAAFAFQKRWSYGASSTWTLSTTEKRSGRAALAPCPVCLSFSFSLHALCMHWRAIFVLDGNQTHDMPRGAWRCGVRHERRDAGMNEHAVRAIRRVRPDCAFHGVLRTLLQQEAQRRGASSFHRICMHH